MGIRFYLGETLRDVTGIAPTETVLNYLRDVEGMTGTKEGCAEGDCGACTVMVVEPVADGGQRHRCVNACIQFLPTLDGKQLLTVEHLQDPDGAPHPVQKAMVAAHGSQCGFCTPGFIMALYALYRDCLAAGSRSPTRREIDRQLAGNLCRCTGYGPIVHAAGMMMQETPNRAEVRLAVPTLPQPSAAYDAESRSYFAPRGLQELGHLLQAYPEATLLAGGTDVGLWVTKQHRILPAVIYVGHVQELLICRRSDKAVEIGAAVTYEDAFALLVANYADLAPLLQRLGSRQVRSLGTIGGNIANGSPIGDMPPPLIALSAELTLYSATGRRHLPLEDFFLDYGKQDRHPDECVEHVSVPMLPEEAIFRCYKISKRFDQDISAVLGAFCLRFDGDPERESVKVISARIAFGGMAAIPKRAINVEAALTGLTWSRETIERGIAEFDRDFTPIDDMRASAAYRLQVAKNLLRKYYTETTEPNVKTRLYDQNPAA